MQLRIIIAMCMVEIRNRKTFSRKLIYAKVTSKSATMPTAYMVIRQQRLRVIRQQLPLMISGICSPLNTHLFLFVLEINKS